MRFFLKFFPIAFFSLFAFLFWKKSCFEFFKRRIYKVRYFYLQCWTESHQSEEHQYYPNAYRSQAAIYLFSLLFLKIFNSLFTAMEKITCVINLIRQLFIFLKQKSQQSVTQTGCWLKMADFKKATRIPDFLQYSTNIPVS